MGVFQITIEQLARILSARCRMQSVLFSFRKILALHFARSPLHHSYGYASANDRINCLAGFSLNTELCIKHSD